MRKTILLCALSLLPALGIAEQVYVTDKLYLGIYQNSDGSGPQLKAIPSGTVLDVQERQGLYARIKTEDGTEGWVKSHFLVTNAPAIVRIREFESQVENLETLQNDLKQQKIKNEEINKDLASLNKSLGSKNKSIADLEKQLKELKASTSKPAEPGSTETESIAVEAPTSEPTVALAVTETGWRALYKTVNANAGPTILIALLLAAIGFLSGYKALELHIKRKHGGYRVW